MSLVVNVGNKSWIQPTLMTIYSQHWDWTSWVPVKQLDLVKILQDFDKNSTSDANTIGRKGETVYFLPPENTFQASWRVLALTNVQF